MCIKKDDVVYQKNAGIDFFARTYFVSVGRYVIIKYYFAAFGFGTLLLVGVIGVQ